MFRYENVLRILFILLLFTPFEFAWGETLSSGANMSSGRSSGDLQFACQIAGALRLTLDSMKCDCNASNSCAGGPLPNDSGDCAAPASQSGSSAATGVPYRLGARPSLGATVDPGSAIDCSGFASAGMCRAGTPFVPGQPCKDLTTAAMLQALKSGNSCYEPVNAGSSQPNLQPGDMVVYQHSGQAIGHVFFIDRTNSSDCHDFSIIQAAGSKTGVGITDVGSHPATSDDQGMALEAAKDVNCGGSSQSGDRVQIVRFNPQKSGCELSPRKLKNESCVDQCEVGRMMDHG